MGVLTSTTWGASSEVGPHADFLVATRAPQRHLRLPHLAQWQQCSSTIFGGVAHLRPWKSGTAEGCRETQEVEVVGHQSFNTLGGLHSYSTTQSRHSELYRQGVHLKPLFTTEFAQATTMQVTPGCMPISVDTQPTKATIRGAIRSIAISANYGRAYHCRWCPEGFPTLRMKYL